MKNIKKILNKLKMKDVVPIILIGLLSINLSYGYFKLDLKGDANIAKSDCFDIAFSDDTASLTLKKMYPISDEKGMKNSGYTFTIKNICSMYASYQVNLESLSVSKKLSDDYVKVSLNNSTPRILSKFASSNVTLKDAVAAYTLTFGRLSPKGEDGSTATYTLKLWMDYDAPLSDATTKAEFSNKVTVIATPKTYEELASTISLRENGVYSNSTHTADVNVSSQKYNIVEYSYDNATYTSLDNPSKNVSLLVNRLEHKGDKIYFKDEVGNITEENLLTYSFLTDITIKGNSFHLKINSTPDNKNIIGYQYSTDNNNWTTSSVNEYTFANIDDNTVIYAKVMYDDGTNDEFRANVIDLKVAKYNDNYYGSLQTAISNLDNSATVNTVDLLKNTNENLEIASNQNIILNLNNNNVTCDDNKTALIVNNGNLAINNGSINCDGNAIINGSESNNAISLGLNGVDVTSTNGAALQNYGTVNQDGGSLSTSSSGSIGVINYANGVYTLLNGNIFSKNTNALKNIGTFNMNDGSLYNSTTRAIPALINDGGTIKLNGGKVYINTDNNSFIIYNISGTLNIDGVSLSSDTGSVIKNESGALLNVISGNLSSTKHAVIYNYGNTVQTGGYISSDTNGIYNFSNGVYRLSNGNIVSSSLYAVSNIGDFEMLGGNISNSTNYAFLNKGTATFRGGSITTTGTDALIYNMSGTANFAGIELSNDNGYVLNNNSNSISNIKSGVLKSENKAVLSNFGTIYQTGGSLISNASSVVGMVNGSTGTYELSDGSIYSKNANAIKNSGKFNMSGGSISNSKSSPVYWNNAGTFTLTGGNISTTSTATLIYNLSTVNISDITLTAPKTIASNGTSSNKTAILNTENCIFNGKLINYGTANITNGEINVTGNNAINNFNSVIIKGNASITNNSSSYPTIYNYSGATITKDDTVSVTNNGGGQTIYNAS